jgi:hypothetical protein
MTIRVEYDDEGWQFEGTSTAFPDDWKTLCRLHGGK